MTCLEALLESLRTGHGRQRKSDYRAYGRRAYDQAFQAAYLVRDADGRWIPGAGTYAAIERHIASRQGSPSWQRVLRSRFAARCRWASDGRAA